MKKPNEIMWKMIWRQYALAIAFIIPVFIAFTFYYTYASNMIKDGLDQTSLIHRDVLVMEIDAHFSEIESLISTTSLYLKDNLEEENVYAYLVTLLQSNDKLTSLYFGSPDNEMINASGFTPPPTFDLRTRPWYTRAIEVDYIVYTPAFMNASQDKIIISLSQAIYKEDVLLGVLAADVDIQTISNLISEMTIVDTGYSFLVDQNNQLLAHPNLLTSSLQLISADTISESISPLFGNEGRINIVIDNQEGILFYETIKDNAYFLGVFVPISDYMSGLQLLQFTFFIIIAVLFLFGILLFILQYYYFVKPINLLEKEINQININAQIDYRLPDHKISGFDALRNTINSTLDTAESYFKDLNTMIEKLNYQANHDQLTKLKNRHAYQQDIAILDHPDYYPLGILIADVNGLKLFNDSFGHLQGDSILQDTATILCNVFSLEYVYRMGGDEFIILLPNTNLSDVIELVQKANIEATKYQFMNIEVSLSFGYAIKESREQSLQDLLKIAEDFMYKQKLIGGTSSRTRTIDTIIQTLFEKSQREESHSKRVMMICEIMGRKLEFHRDRINELRTAGLLHDIGKIGIDVQILNKESKLSDDEWMIIKRHPEIGYRILNTVNELAEIALIVLSHHERYDGKGYPRGIQGESIPIESRILSIADAYDAMISYRPYRPSLTPEQALLELKKHARTQFDPKLVEVFISIVQEIE